MNIFNYIRQNILLKFIGVYIQRYSADYAASICVAPCKVVKDLNTHTAKSTYCTNR